MLLSWGQASAEHLLRNACQERGSTSSCSTSATWAVGARARARHSFSRPAALVSQTAAELDCHRLTHALLARAAANGARIFDQTPVNKFETAVDGVRLQTNRSCKVVADHAVFATGYEAQELLPKRVVKLKSTYAIASEPLREFPGWWERCLIRDAILNRPNANARLFRFDR
jgi:glycine/D-amino acid oxidase-like deaminating enzyme